MTFGVSIKNMTLARGERVLIDGLSFQVNAGEALWVQGDHGMGKTSLLNALCGLIELNSGSIDWQINNKPCVPSELLALQSHQDGFKPYITCEDELVFWAALYQYTEGVHKILETVGLHASAKVPTRALSAGQRRRLSLARLMVSKRPLWIMDEPYAVMDVDGTALIDAELTRHIKAGGSAVIASHRTAKKLSSKTRRLTLETV